jgi:hypothetical protein
LIRKKNSAGCNRRRKKKEKTILRILCSCTFSHSLDPERTLRVVIEGKTEIEA